MYNFGSFDAFIVKPTILPEICSTINVYSVVLCTLGGGWGGGVVKGVLISLSTCRKSEVRKSKLNLAWI